MENDPLYGVPFSMSKGDVLPCDRGEIPDGVRLFHRKLETIQRRSGWADEAVSELSEKMY